MADQGGPGWPKAVVFDLDGTLIDSVADIAGALNAALGDAGLPDFSEDAVRGMVGGGARVLIQRALAHHGAASPLVQEALHGRFLHHYRAVPAEKTRLYEGALDLLAALGDRQVKLGICTNKPHDLTLSIVTALGIGGHFGSVVGARDDVPRKPHPAMLQNVLAELQSDAADAVMIGDSIADVETARAAGIPIILVSFGYTPVPARELGADAVIDHLSELAAALRAIYLRRR